MSVPLFKRRQLGIVIMLQEMEGNVGAFRCRILT